MRLSKKMSKPLALLFGAVLLLAGCELHPARHYGCAFGLPEKKWGLVHAGVRADGLDFFVVQVGADGAPVLCRCIYEGARRIIESCELECAGKKIKVLGTRKLYIVINQECYSFPVSSNPVLTDDLFKSMDLQSLIRLVRKIAGSEAAQLLQGLGPPTGKPTDTAKPN